MSYFKKSRVLFKRSIFNPHFQKVSFLPLDNLAHPVWQTHIKYLQDKTSWPFPGKTLHVVNRLPKFLINFSYIAEVESLFSILHKEITRDNNFRISDAVTKIESEIKNGKLKQIIFQSPSAFLLNQHFMTPAIEDISKVAHLVPTEINKRNLSSEKNFIKILIIGSSNYRKGLFLLKNIVPMVRKHNPEIYFTCISAVQIPELLNIDGLEIKVIPRMNSDIRRRLYNHSDYLLNLALGDTLGIFLESIQFNIPIIGFSGQHGNSYVPEGSGILINAPIFEYDNAGFNNKWTYQSFPNYIKELNTKKFFSQVEIELASIIVKLTLGDKYRDMLKNQYDFASKKLTVNKWLNNISEIYREIQ